MGTPRIDSLDRNFLMNGGFDFWQRSLSKLVNNGSAEYVADRWIMGPGIDGVAGSQTTYSRQTDTPDNSVNYSAQAVGSYVPNEEFSFFQRVESIFAKMLSNKKTSLAFNYKTDGCDEVRIKILKPTVADNFSTLTQIYNQTFTIVNDNNWNEIKLESLNLGEVNNGLQVQITFISNTTGVVTTKIAKPKINIGTKAQDFSYAGRDYVEELQLCQRYFEKTYNIDVPVGTVTQIGAMFDNTFNNAAVGLYFHFIYKVTKRSIPVVTAYSNITGAANFASKGGVDVVVNYNDVGIYESAGNINNSGNQWCSAHWTADCEL